MRATIGVYKGNDTWEDQEVDIRDVLTSREVKMAKWVMRFCKRFNVFLGDPYYYGRAEHSLNECEMHVNNVGNGRNDTSQVCIEFANENHVVMYGEKHDKCITVWRKQCK